MTMFDSFMQLGFLSTGVVMGGIFALVGLLLLGIGWAQGKEARAAANWNAVQGEVLESSVEQYSYRDGEGDLNTGYRPRIMYGYRVGGRDYVGERLNFGSSVHTSLKSIAENKAKGFPTGSGVEVFYNPSDPNDAVLERAAPASRLLYIIGGIFVLVAALSCGGFAIFGNMIFE